MKGDTPVSKKYPRIKAAFEGEAKSAWQAVDAIQAELPVDQQDYEYGDLLRVADYLEREGIEVSYGVLRCRARVARFMVGATTDQVRHIRQCAVNTVVEFAQAGWSTAELADFIVREGVPKKAATRAATRAGASASDEPSKWDDSQWVKFDKKVGNALKVLREARLYQREGIYEPSEANGLLLALTDGVDWDAELAELTK